jgi:four helix bundle protein
MAEQGAVSLERGERARSVERMSEFRFQNLEIWQRTCELTRQFFKLAGEFDARCYYRFAEQVRPAALSVSNNIAEGSGSYSKDEFRHFLNIARRSVFECASMLCLFAQDGLVAEAARLELLTQLEQLSRMLSSFRNSLK